MESQEKKESDGKRKALEKGLTNQKGHISNHIH